jgi:hypothetical protein
MFSRVAGVKAVPIQIPLEAAIQEADIVVVGKLGKLLKQPIPKRGPQRATGTITIIEVLKGDPKLEAVILQTTVGRVYGPVQYTEGATGIWILKKLSNSKYYTGGDPSSLQSIKRLRTIKEEIARPK